MNMMMIDLETLGVSRDSVVLSAGILIFDEQYMHGSSHLFMDTREQIQKGRSISESTVAWWLLTDRLSFSKLLGAGTITLKNLEDEVNRLYKEHDVKRVWSRGSLDLDILRDIFTVPWGYAQERDVRTLDEFGVMSANGHDALADCVNQAEFVQRILRRCKDAK